MNAPDLTPEMKAAGWTLREGDNGPFFQKQLHLADRSPGLDLFVFPSPPCAHEPKGGWYWESSLHLDGDSSKTFQTPALAALAAERRVHEDLYALFTEHSKRRFKPPSDYVFCDKPLGGGDKCERLLGHEGECVTVPF